MQGHRKTTKQNQGNNAPTKGVQQRNRSCQNKINPEILELKNRMNNKMNTKHNKIATVISITLNINGLNFPMEKQRMSELFF